MFDTIWKALHQCSFLLPSEKNNFVKKMYDLVQASDDYRPYCNNNNTFHYQFNLKNNLLKFINFSTINLICSKKIK
jgi:hypothetical protein